MKANLKKTFFLFRLGIVVLILALSYWQIISGPSLAIRPENPRLLKQEEKLLRGRILDRKGRVISFTENKERIYQGPRAIAPLVGYTQAQRGQSGLELAYSSELLGQLPVQRFRNFTRGLLGRVPTGSDLYLTLDLSLVEAAEKALAGRAGAVGGLDVQTGEILVIATSPNFSPNRIAEDWVLLTADRKSPLLNRALQGLYPPGSIFKLLTAYGVLKWELVAPGEQFVCSGKIEIDGHTISCYQGKAHGRLDFDEALAKSCNVTFVQLAQRLGRERFYELIEFFALARKPDLGVPVSMCRIPPQKGAGASSLSQLAIGQGALLVTPVQMAMLTAALASGTVRSPYLVREIKSGDVVLQKNESSWQLELETVSASLKNALRYVVEQGTGQAAGIPGLSVAGKTGTADNPHGRPHAWFVGFAPVENPRLALAVVVENAGEGGRFAAPIARLVFEEAMKNGYL